MQCHEFNQHVADYVLGQLSEDELGQVEQHLAGCEACRQLAVATSEAAALLPQALPQTPPPAVLERRLLEAIAGPKTLPISEATVGGRVSSTRGRSRRRLGWLWAASLLASAGVGGWIGTSVHAPQSERVAAVDAAARQEARQRLAQRIEAAKQTHGPAEGPDLRYAAMKGEAAAHGYIARDPSARQWHLLIGGLAELPEGRAYHVWLGVEDDGQQVKWTSGGVLRVDGQGSASMVISMPDDSQSVARLMVTDERPGAEAPTGRPHLVSDL